MAIQLQLSRFRAPSIPKKPISPSDGKTPAPKFIVGKSNPGNVVKVVNANVVLGSGSAAPATPIPATPASSYWYENGTFWALAPQGVNWYPQPTGMYAVAFTNLQSFQQFATAYQFSGPYATPAWTAIPSSWYSPAFGASDLPGFYVYSTTDGAVFMLFCCRPSLLPFLQSALAGILIPNSLLGLGSGAGPIARPSPASTVAPGVGSTCTALTTNGVEGIVVQYLLIAYSTTIAPVYPYLFSAATAPGS